MQQLIHLLGEPQGKMFSNVCAKVLGKTGHNVWGLDSHDWMGTKFTNWVIARISR